MSANKPRAQEPSDENLTRASAREVPERIDKWPDDDTTLRAYGWLDRLGSVWRYEHAGAIAGWSCPGMSPQDQPWGSPFTRVNDLTERLVDG